MLNLRAYIRGPVFAFYLSMTNSEVFPIWQSKTGTKNKNEPVPLSDHALAIAAGKGDMQAFEMLYERHNRRVYSLCLRMTQNPAEAEDLAQEAFIQLFRKIGSFRGESAFTTWLHRLTVNAGGTRGGLAPFVDAHAGPQQTDDLGPGPLISPLRKVVVHATLRQQVVR